MLGDSLFYDQSGAPLRRNAKSRSDDWDEVQEFCRRVYMPYRVRPLERGARPDATMLATEARRVTLTRFSYGAGIHLDRFDPAAGNILVLNTLRGALRHHCGAQPATTAAGESFVVDCSRTDYWLDGDRDHMQFNLTIPHSVMEEVAERWFGFVPDDRLWTRRVKFGGPRSQWNDFLRYVARTLGGDLPVPRNGALARHLEELICVELLREWAVGAGVDLENGARAAAPGYVRRAEEILAAEAREAPSIGDVAQRVGVSARTLSEGFRRFRGVTPRAFLSARRLDGLRRDLETAPRHRGVGDVAAEWGVVNLGVLAAAYRKRFGEAPSETRARARGSA
jgi:AraC-like DNA-binding protein